MEDVAEQEQWKNTGNRVYVVEMFLPYMEGNVVNSLYAKALTEYLDSQIVTHVMLDVVAGLGQFVKVPNLACQTMKGRLLVSFAVVT